MLEQMEAGLGVEYKREFILNLLKTGEPEQIRKLAVCFVNSARNNAAFAKLTGYWSLDQRGREHLHVTVLDIFKLYLNKGLREKLTEILMEREPLLLC